VSVREPQRQVDEAGHPFQPVFGEQHGDALVVHQSLQGRHDVFGALRIELGRRLVQHEDPRPAASAAAIATR
jgi:hypothetical protein